MYLYYYFYASVSILIFFCVCIRLEWFKLMTEADYPYKICSLWTPMGRCVHVTASSSAWETLFGNWKGEDDPGLT